MKWENLIKSICFYTSTPIYHPTEWNGNENRNETLRIFNFSILIKITVWSFLLALKRFCVYGDNIIMYEYLYVNTI